MQTLKIEADYRSDMSKSRIKQIRRKGYVTASVSGHDTDSVSIELDIVDLAKQIKDSDAGLTSLINLKIKGAPKKSDGTVIIKSFSRDPLTRKVLDVQLQRISMKEKIAVHIPIELDGEAPGTKEGGMLDQVTNELIVNCLPADIPPRISIDVSHVQIGDIIRVQDVKVDKDIEVITDGDTVICSCKPPIVAAGGGKATEGAPAAEESGEAGA